MNEPKKKHSNTFSSTIRTTRKGLGFVSHPDFEDDIRIERENILTALNGDTVEVCLLPKEKGSKDRQGEVTKIIKRAKLRFVGRAEYEGPLLFVVPDDSKVYTDILITKPKETIKDNDKVLVKIVKWDDPAKDPIGEIVKVLGQKGEHEVEIQSIVLEHNIDTDFPREVERETAPIAQKGLEELKKLPAPSGDFVTSNGVKRRDFRTTTTFTIDPKTAKDFDDALSVSPRENGLYEIGIHIADVSHYVRHGTSLDQEALTRGFSVYLVDRTIPMLPKKLSNDLCSLNPDVSRFTFSVTFVIDMKGTIHEKWFGKGIIHSDKRFTYEEAQNILDSAGGKASNGTHPYSKELRVLNTIAEVLRKERFQKGAIDFDSSEVQIDIDTKGVPTHIYRKARLATHKLVEEWMLLANKHVAQKIWEDHSDQKKKPAFLYRVHDVPKQERIEEITQFVRGLGYSFGGNSKKITPKDINTLFSEIEGTSTEGLIKKALVRSMAKAVYATDNIGHFGLGFPDYTHFTSPIRRYSDLLVHRLLQNHLLGEHPDERLLEELQAHADHLSEREISVTRAARESISYKQVEYMSLRIGQEFKGIISGVVGWGLYVEEAETGAEGLVPVRTLTDDYYTLDSAKYELRGERTKKTYKLGDTVTFKVEKADIDQKTLDYKLV